MSHRIFKKGDKVVLKKKAPKWILEEVSPYVARTITGVYYNKKGGYAHYYLGRSARGYDISMYGFRAYMLDYWVPLRKDRTYKRAQSLQSKLQKSMRDNTAKAGSPFSRASGDYIIGEGRDGHRNRE